MTKRKNHNTEAQPKGLNAMRDLHKLMEQQDFQSEADIEAFMHKMHTEGIPEFIADSDADKAEAMVLAAWEKTPAQAGKAARKALELDPECIVAFELLADREVNVSVAIAFFQRGMAIGAKHFMGEYREQNEGHFWGLTETRPFMRCLERFADLMFWTGHLTEASVIWEDLLKLNPMDNQGVRYPYAALLAATGDTERYNALEKEFGDDASAAAAYNKALFRFATMGPGPQATKALQAAVKNNSHVAPILLAAVPPLEMPYGYMLGSPEEALSYCHYAYALWNGCPGAADWLRGQV